MISIKSFKNYLARIFESLVDIATSFGNLWLQIGLDLSQQLWNNASSCFRSGMVTNKFFMLIGSQSTVSLGIRFSVISEEKIWFWVCDG